MNNLEQFKILMAMDANYMPAEFDGDVFHYTSPTGFQSILFANKYDLTLWASRYDCLNDISEGTVAEEMLQETAKDLFVRKEISKELYELFSSIKPARTIPLYRDINGDLKVTRVECDRYICSFSKNSDSLAMWNYYSKGAKYEGFNIGFYSKGIKDSLERSFVGIEVATHIYPVVYDKSVQKKLIERMLLKLKDFYSEENIPRIRAIVSTRLLDWSLVFKKDYFQHEEEVRIIIDLSKRESQLPVYHRINAGYVIPYIKMKLDQDDVSHITFGPLQGGKDQIEHQAKVMEEMLRSNGYALARVGYSNIPIRY